MNRKTNQPKTRRTHEFQGIVIYKATNPLTGKFEQVDPESELTPDTMVMPLFWVTSDQIYVTIPGTEVYGYVPEGR